MMTTPRHAGPAGAEAVATVFAERRDRLVAVARRILGDDHEAEDCVQDALMRALYHIDRFDGRSRLFTWLYRITVNEALMRLRGRRRRGPADPLDAVSELADEQAVSPEAAAIRRDQGRFLERHLARLSDGDRAVIRYRKLAGYSTAETAAALGLSDAATKVRLHRAMTRLKAELAEAA